MDKSVNPMMLRVVPLQATSKRKLRKTSCEIGGWIELAALEGFGASWFCYHGWNLLKQAVRVEVDGTY
jgi:hypothetical protein